MAFYIPALQHFYEAYQDTVFSSKWGCRWWPDTTGMDEEDREALTCDSGARFESERWAVGYAKSQMQKELEARKEEHRRRHGEERQDGPRTAGRYVAPWGDTYTAQDCENGYLPLEAVWQETEVGE
jgi:hypothetical protein